MKIGVIGAGRLGICFALLAESAGHDVFVSDVQASYVSKLNAKELYSNEPEVEDLLLRSKKLRASTNNQDVIKSSDVIPITHTIAITTNNLIAIDLEV